MIEAVKQAKVDTMVGAVAVPFHNPDVFRRLHLKRNMCVDNIPESYRLRPLMDKIGWVKGRIKSKTWLSDKTSAVAPGELVLPKGFCVVEGPPLPFESMFDDMVRLFKDRATQQPSIPFDDLVDRKLVFMLSKGKKNLPATTGMSLLRQAGFQSLANNVQTQTDRALDLFEIAKSEREAFLFKECRLVFIRYEDNTGIEVHMDNVMRTNRGPIITVNIGPPTVFFDLIPVLQCEERHYPIRVRLRQGDLCIMDGASRVNWAHAIPYGAKYSKQYKFTILLLFNKFRELNPVFNPVLDIEVTESSTACARSKSAPLRLRSQLRPLLMPSVVKTEVKAKAKAEVKAKAKTKKTPARKKTKPAAT